MKYLLLTSILVFAFCFCAFGQTNETSSCPTISVTGPSAIPEPNAIVTFSVNINLKEEEQKFDYVWSVSAGEIVSGQGTKIIGVKMPSDGASVTATVKISNFPEGCPNTSSESLVCVLIPQAVKLDEFTLDERQIDKARLDNLITELQQDPTSQAYIIEKFNRKTTEAVIKRKIQKITNHLKLRNQDAERFTIVFDLAEQNSTQLWIVPAGANPPKIKDN